MKIIYLSRDDGRDVRITKMCNSLAGLGHEVVFVGWDRTPEKPKGADIHLVPVVKRRIFARSAVIGKGSFSGWGGFFRHVVRALREERPDVVQAINEEKALLVLPFKHLLYRKLVIDVFDSVVANHYPKGVLNAAALACRWLGNWGADYIIETSRDLQSMLGRFASKSIIIENAPLDPGDELSKVVPKDGPIRVGIGGSLTDRRMGLKWLVAAVDLLPAGSVVIEASGRLVDNYAQDVFSKHKSVHYQWLSSPRDFLDVAARCDALLYLRTDAHESRYRAAVLPNRVFDALAVGRPLIVNSGLVIADWIEKERLGQVVADGDTESLAKAIQNLLQARRNLPETARRLRTIFQNGHTWPVMEKRLAEMYEWIRVS